MSAERIQGQPDDKGIETWSDLERSLVAYNRDSAINVGNYMRRAMLELAYEMGGQELVNIVGPRILDRTTIIPSLAFAEFEHNRPGISSQIMDRTTIIQKRHNREDWIRVVTYRKPRSSEELLTAPLTPKQSRLQTLFQRNGRQA